MKKFIVCIAAISCLSTSLLAQESLDEKNLMLYSSFDSGVKPDMVKNDAGIKDAEGKFQLVSGKYGKAVYFGEGKKNPCELVYSAGETFKGDEWTVAAWIKLDTSGKDRGTVFRAFTTGGWKDGDLFAQFDKWNNFIFNIFDAKGNYCDSRISSKIIPAQKWTHLAFTSKNGKQKIYVNGVEVNYTTQKDVLDPGRFQKYIRIGHCSKNASPLKGSIDELKLYNKALDEKGLKGAMNPGPKKEITDLKPTFYVPFEGDVEPASGSPDASANYSKINFAKGVVGKGVVIMRHGYDSKGVLNFKGIPGLFGDAMSLSFFFIPEWEGASDDEHGLLASKGDGANWIIKEKNGALSFKLTSGDKSASAQLSTKQWKKKQPVFISAGYSISKKQMHLSVNAEKIKEAPLPSNFSFSSTCGKNALLIVGDTLTVERFQKTQANGVLDEIRIFDKELTPKECKAEFARKDTATAVVANKGWTIKEIPPSIEERKLWDLNGAWKSSTATRERICLNALWRFQLTNSPNQSPNPKDWQYLAAPGRYSGEGNGRSDHQFLIRDKNLKPVKANGMNQKWKGKSGRHYRSAWFERAFKANPDWKNKIITLCFEELGLTESGLLFLNGKEIAELSDQKEYKINIPANSLRYKGDNFIILQTYDRGNGWAWRGIKGDIFLDIFDKIMIENPAVTTSVKDKKITIEMRVKNQSGKTVKLIPECILMGENSPGEIIGKSIDLKSGETINVKLDKEWSNPHLWDYTDPYLYQCALSLRNADGEIIDEYPSFKIGFREFTIKGGDYVLNGKKIHLRNHDSWPNSTMDYEWCKKFVRLLKDAGYNSMRAPFNDKDSYMKNIFRACDEEGLLLFVNAVGVGAGDFALWKNPETKKRVLSNMKSTVDASRNNPSVVLWYLSVNQLGYGWDYHPLKMADGYLPKFREAKAKACQEAADELKKYDTSREYFFQAGGAYGPIINSNAYFNWWPDAERAAWPLEWSKRKTKPLHIIETSFPYWHGLLGMDLRYPQGKPLFLLENAARYYGQEAYDKQNDEWLHLMTDPAGKSKSSLQWNLIANLRKDQKLYYKLKGDMLVPTIHAWRGADMSGINPFAEYAYSYQRTSPYSSIHSSVQKNVKVADFRTPGWHPDIVKISPHKDINTEKPTPYLQSLKEALTPTLVYIGGDKKDPTSKNHSCFANGKIEKSIVMINDNRQDEKFELCWKLMDNERAVKEASFEATLAPGEIAKLPVELTAPNTDKTIQLKLTVDVKSPKNVTVKSFDITVFPRIKEIKTETKTALYDMTGQTRDALKELGIKTENVQELSSLDGYGLLIIGRESLSRNFEKLAKQLKLNERLQEGLINIVVLEQQPDALKLLGLKSFPIYSRRAFKSGGNSQLLNDLAEKDLQWWNGHGTLAPEYKEPDSATEESVSSPLWHWSNLNMVSSFPVRRPSSGANRVHLSMGQDLVYTPLFEMAAGKGKVLFCQMETIGRSNDEPAAAVLLKNIVQAFSNKNKDKNFRELYYLKDDCCAKFLSELGFKATPVKTVGEINENGMLIVARKLSETEEKEIRSLAEKGANIVFMPLSKTEAESFGLKLKDIKINRYEIAKAGESLLSELSARDRFLRYAQETSELAGQGIVPLVSPAFAAERKAGKGAYIFVQLAPSAMEAKIERDKKIGLCTSNLWADSLVKERLMAFWGTLLKELGAEGESIAGRFVQMNIQGEEQDISGKWKFHTDPKNIGQKDKWNLPAIADKLDCQELKVPGYWESQGVTQKNPNYKSPGKKFSGYDGYAWYFANVKVDKKLQGKDLILKFGAIDDNDWVYVNGKQIGYTDTNTLGYWAAARNYQLPASMTKDGELNIAVRVFDIRGDGGITGFAKLVEKVDKANISALPYYTKEMPFYNTESHIRW